MIYFNSLQNSSYLLKNNSTITSSSHRNQSKEKYYLQSDCMMKTTLSVKY